jgi:hypothetical protein
MTATWRWTGAVLLVAAPLVAALCLTLWRSPFPVTEAVAIFEDIAQNTPTRFLTPDTSYYRPFFHMTISTIWHNVESLETRLSLIKLLTIVPVVVLVTTLIAYLKPRTMLEAAAAAVAVAVLMGSPGFRDNLELPLSYTTVGMPLALIAWILLNRQRTLWSQLAIVACALVALGFKEQGLVIVPLVLAAWWMKAPGASGWTAAAMVALTGGYVVLRLAWKEAWPMFEQAVGFGFGEMEPPEAEARFGSFPYVIYSYSGLATILNVLFSEPTRGTFTIVRRLVYARPEPWELVHLGSSVALTALIGWWAVRSWKDAIRGGWTAEARSAAALVVVLLACGVLSFNYSRDRLGGMAVPFYALAAFYAVRSAAAYAGSAAGVRAVAFACMLFVAASGWPVRALGTIERIRLQSYRNHQEWLVLLPSRRLEFATRRHYLDIMHAMIEQGTAPGAPSPTRYPRLVARFIAELPPS